MTPENNQPEKTTSDFPKKDLVVFISDYSKTRRPSSNYQKEFPQTEVRRAEYPLNQIEVKKLITESSQGLVAVVCIESLRFTQASINEIISNLAPYSIPVITLSLQESSSEKLATRQAKLFKQIRTALHGK